MAKNRWTDEVLDPARLVGDPLADDLVGPLLDDGSASLVSSMLATMRTSHDVINDELPIDVAEYLEISGELPSWADPAKLEAAEDFFGRAGFPIVIGLFCYSLPEAYAAEKGAQVLARTGRLDSDARRRILETGQFVIDVMAPGGLAPGGAGIHAAQRVRLMHAAIRHLILFHGHEGDRAWNGAWGHPINQEDLVATELSFAVTATEALPKLWYEVEDDDAEAFLHAWKVVGHLLGVREDLQPVDVADAAALADSVRRRHFGPSPEGRELTEALIELLDELDAGEHLDGMNRTMIRHLVGDETADLLGVGPPARTYGLFTLMKVAMHLTSRHAANNRFLEGAVETLGRSVLEGMFAYERRGLGEATFAIPESLADRWHMPHATHGSTHAPTRRPTPRRTRRPTRRHAHR
jgi:hypothetical protein